MEYENYKRHEKIGLADLYLADCMDMLPQVPDNYYDLCICDPPYGINISKSGKVGWWKLAPATHYGAKEWDSDAPDKLYFDFLRTKSENQVIWGANHFISKLAIDSPCWIVWDKQNTGNFADCELAWSSFKTAVKKFEFMWNGMLQGNMKNKEERIHPTQKPVALYAWLLKNYAKPGQTILDTHMGSGSSVIACLDAGHPITAYELDPDYFDAACKRIEEAQRQQKLF